MTNWDQRIAQRYLAHNSVAGLMNPNRKGDWLSNETKQNKTANLLVQVFGSPQTYTHTHSLTKKKISHTKPQPPRL